MELKKETIDNVLVLHLSGDLKFDQTFEEVHQLVKMSCLSHRPVVINLKNINHFNSTGIGLLTACYITWRDRSLGEFLPLSETPDKIKNILKITRTEKFFHYFASDQEAITALSCSHHF